MSAPYRVVIVDDSAFMRGVVGRMLSSDERFDVVGEAKDGSEAVRIVDEARPDLVTMDYNMPGLNGAEATRRILARRPVAIVMLSAHTKEGAAETVDALAAGAVDFVAKPAGEISPHLSEVRAELISKLLGAAGANLRGMTKKPAPDRAPPSSRARMPPSSRAPRSLRPMPAGLRVIVVASSTGGPAVLMQIVPKLTLDALGAALIVVQHMPRGFTSALAVQLSEASPFDVVEAEADLLLRGGLAIVAPGDHHTIVDRRGRIVLTDDGPVHGVRPAADVTLKAAAQAYGPRALGVVLTGMGRDGGLGLAAVKAAGGRSIAQDRATSTVYGMPRVAVEMGVVDEVAPLGGLADAIHRQIR